MERGSLRFVGFPLVLGGAQALVGLTLAVGSPELAELTELPFPTLVPSPTPKQQDFASPLLFIPPPCAPQGPSLSCPHSLESLSAVVINHGG